MQIWKSPLCQEQVQLALGPQTRNRLSQEPCRTAAARGTGFGRDFLLSLIPVSTRLPLLAAETSFPGEGALLPQLPPSPPPQ